MEDQVRTYVCGEGGLVDHTQVRWSKLTGMGSLDCSSLMVRSKTPEPKAVFLPSEPPDWKMLQRRVEISVSTLGEVTAS